MSEVETIADGLNNLLASYTEPCVGDCDHSQCPLLRELHALRIKATLEKARLTVKPIVDRENQGEQIDGLMNMQLRGTAGGERCAECGHATALHHATDGCFYPPPPSQLRRNGLYCGCKCVFPAPPEAPQVRGTSDAEMDEINVAARQQFNDEATPVPAEAAVRDERTIDRLAREIGTPMWALEVAFELATLGMLDEDTMAGTRVIPDAAQVIAEMVPRLMPSTPTNSAVVEAAGEIVAWLNRTGCLIVGMMDDDAVLAQLNTILSRHFPPAEAAIPDPDPWQEVERLSTEVVRLTAELKSFEVGRHDWVTCPICKERDVLAYFEGDEDDPTGHGWLVHCSNLACSSNISVHAEENRNHDAATARANAIDEALTEVTDLRKAHPESVFTPIADNETSKVHERWPGLVDRISAHMARHLLDVLVTALEALKQKDRKDG